MAANPPVLLTNLRLIDGTGGDPREDWELLVEDGRISRSAPAGTVLGAAVPGTEAGTREDGEPAEAPDRARLRVLDLAGAAVLPGFIDCHVHMTTVPGGDRLDLIGSQSSLRTLRGARFLRETLHAGVTTVRDLSGADAGMRAAVEEGSVPGPRLLVALRILSITGGHGDWRALNGVDLTGGSGGGVVADGPDEFVRATRAVVREGGDWIKIAASGGMTSPRGMPEHGGLTREEMAAVVTEAGRHGGIGVAAHAQGTRAVADAVAAGVRSIEHGYGIDDATIQEMGERGTFLVPTLSTLTRPAEARQPTPQQETPHQSHLRRFRELAVERLHVAVSSGIPIALGTDAGVVPHGSNLREVALLVRFGLSPLQAITAGTSAAARLLGLDGETGTLREGLAADLIAVRGDPLADPGVLAEPDAIRLVMRQGSIERKEIL